MIIKDNVLSNCTGIFLDHSAEIFSFSSGDVSRRRTYAPAQSGRRAFRDGDRSCGRVRA